MFFLILPSLNIIFEPNFRYSGFLINANLTFALSPVLIFETDICVIVAVCLILPVCTRLNFYQ